MTPVEIYSVKMSNEQIGAYQNSAYLFDASAGDAPVQLTLGDAFTYAADGNGMMRLGAAEVCFRRGINNRSGVVEPSGSSTYEFYATPTLDANEYAIVLTWGQHPYDMDSHLFTTAGTSTGHIWFGGPQDSFHNYLDVDDTDSYGPETVTIRNFTASNYYKYCVVDYTDCSSGNFHSLDMSYSQACVNVYSSEGLVATYNVPTGQAGVIWEVFEIRNGQITPIQRYYSNAEDKTWWHSEK